MLLRDQLEASLLRVGIAIPDLGATLDNLRVRAGHAREVNLEI